MKNKDVEDWMADKSSSLGSIMGSMTVTKRKKKLQSIFFRSKSALWSYVAHTHARDTHKTAPYASCQAIATHHSDEAILR